MDFITNYKLENYILDTKWEDFPQKVKERAVVCAIDLIMALTLGSKGRQFEAGVSLAKELYKEGNVPVVGLNDTFNVMGATVAMGHASNSFDIDDGHNMIKGHPGTAIIAGVLAAALDKKITYKEFLTTLVVSYETAIRTGLAMQDHYNFMHSTGAYGAVGTCAGMGRIFDFNKEQLNNALSIADFHAPLVPVMRAVEYPSMNKDGVPFGALIGATAIYETLSGSTGQTYTLELKKYEYLLNSLGSNYEIMNLYFKPYTCCRWAHPAIEASLYLINEHNIDIKEIKTINVHTFLAAATLSKIYPKTTDEAQYNIKYPIAVGIVDGDVGIEQVIDERLDREEVLEMMDKINFVVDEKIDSKFPAQRLCKVEFILNNGSSYLSHEFAPPGEAGDNVDLEWIIKKFKRITKPIVSSNNQEIILDLLLTVDDRPIGEIIKSINQVLND